MKKLTNTLSILTIGICLSAGTPVMAQSSDSVKTTTEHSTNNHDDSGKWGLLGLLGLVGLLGLRRRDDRVHSNNTNR